VLEEDMPVKNPKEVFMVLLSDVRHNAEKATNIYQEMGQHAQDPQIKEALQARAFASQQVLAKLDECFRLIGEKPVKPSGRLQETFLEEFRKELGEIQSPAARHLYILAKLNHLAHLRMGEYAALTAAADVAGHQGVGVLLETCLADKLAFAERNRRLIRHVVEAKLAERAAGASA
jgi:ferritin-like metal-binding protein YciE